MVLRVLLVLGAAASALCSRMFDKVLGLPHRQGHRSLARPGRGRCLGGRGYRRSDTKRTSTQTSGELRLPERDAGILIANHQLDTDWFYLCV